MTSHGPCCDDEFSDRRSTATDSDSGGFDMSEIHPDNDGLDDAADAWDDVTHVLVEDQNLTELYTPVRGGLRIKYSAISVSQQYLALGTNSGAVHVFNRQNLHYKVLASSDLKEGCIILLGFCPTDEEILAFVTRCGTVCVMQLNVEKGGRVERLYSSSSNSNKPAAFTTVCWSPQGDSVYLGSDLGLVTRIHVQSSKNVKLLMLDSREVISQFDSSIVQIDTCNDLICISTQTATYIASSEKRQCKKVGTKPRSGAYGACFFKTPAGAGVVYCARPGSRLWKSGVDGQVMSTLQLKHLLEISPLRVVSVSDCTKDVITREPKCKPQSLAFEKLYLLDEKFLLICGPEGIYIIEPKDARIVLWSDELKGAVQIGCYGNDIYLLYGDGSLRHISLLTTFQLFKTFYSAQQWRHCSWLALNLRSCQLPMCCVRDLASRFQQNDVAKFGDEIDRLARLADKVVDDPDKLHRFSVCACRASTQNAKFLRLESGMYARIDQPPNGNAEHEASSSFSCNRQESLANESSNVLVGRISPDLLTTVKNKLGSFKDTIKDSIKEGLIRKISGNPASVVALGDEIDAIVIGDRSSSPDAGALECPAVAEEALHYVDVLLPDDDVGAQLDETTNAP